MLEKTIQARESRLGPSEEACGVKRRVCEWWDARPCGSRVSEEEIGSMAFFEEVERHRYAQEPHIPEVADFAAWKGRAVLEIGCGLGTDLLQFARAGAHVTGVDLTPRAVELTSRRFDVYGVEGRFQVEDAEELSFLDDTFDLVYSNGVLHHTPNTQKAVDEIRRVLKPGGRVIVMLYHKHSYNYWVNICLLRRLAFALIRRGVSVQMLAALTGIHVDLLREYENITRGRSEWTLQDLLNISTDGPGNPLSKVFTRGEAKQMFHRFGSVQTKVYWLVKKNVPIFGKYIPGPLDYALGRLMGWALYVLATK
jgi:ubiquinone/menaquinone biosynthesis C-methylase UbiE